MRLDVVGDLNIVECWVGEVLSKIGTAVAASWVSRRAVVLDDRSVGSAGFSSVRTRILWSLVGACSLVVCSWVSVCLFTVCNCGNDVAGVIRRQTTAKCVHEDDTTKRVADKHDWCIWALCDELVESGNHDWCGFSCLLGVICVWNKVLSCTWECSGNVADCSVEVA